MLGWAFDSRCRVHHIPVVFIPDVLTLQPAPAPAVQFGPSTQATLVAPTSQLAACVPSPVPQDAIIGAYIPPEYQELIMSRCHWEEGAQRWAVEHLEWAGNLVRWEGKKGKRNRKGGKHPAAQRAKRMSCSEVGTGWH